MKDSEEEEGRTMPPTLSVHEAKREFSSLVRESAELGQVFLVANAQRKHAPRTVILGASVMKAMLESYAFHPQWEEDTQQRLWTVYVPEIDVWGQGPSQEDAAKDLVDAALDYADVYRHDVGFYAKVGKAGHFPYVLRLLLAEDTEQVRSILGV
jgi:hypothetical protein